MNLKETGTLSTAITDQLAEKGLYLALVEIPSIKRALEEKKFASDLTKKEWEHAKKYHQMQRKLSWLSGQIAGKYAYRKLYPSISMQECEILRNEIGAPFIVNEENAFISISHSDNYAIASISESKIGVDIEKVRERPQSFINTWLSIREQELCNNLYGKEKQVFVNKCWTVKEAYSKLLGIGGHLPFRRFCSLEHPEILGIELESFQLQDYVISIVWDKPDDKQTKNTGGINEQKKTKNYQI